ncbi:MAG: trehalose-phosphatase [Acidimicrobiales bacterium]
MSAADRAGDPLAPFLARPERSGVVTDFDGTLAPIVEDPAVSRPLPGAVDVLHRLADRYAVVAVVSGRPVAFLAEHLGMAGGGRLVLAGLYGLERVDGGAPSTAPGVEAWRPVVAEVAALAEATAPPGLRVERKGLSVAVHYRGEPALQEWAEAFARRQAARTGLARHPARMSQELRPPLPVDKGSVVAGLVAGLDAACFVGDDQGDLPAFAALDELRRTPGRHALKVAVRSTEAPPALLAAADLLVDGPEGALALLRQLVG